MVTRVHQLRCLAVVTLCVAAEAPADWSVRGNLSSELRLFAEEARHSADQTAGLSLWSEAELFNDLGNGHAVVVSPFARWDQHDDQRTHADFRELLYWYAGDSWEFRAGLGKVFWGVAESVNPVDIINQRDAVESVQTSAKLGQPMIALTAIRDWGNLAVYVLPGFREQSFAGVDGRPRVPVPIDADAASYESADENRHLDLAVRWSHSLGAWDLGVHGFSGTSRTPSLRLSGDGASLQPHYSLIDQVGVDAQATLDSWLLKSELVYRRGDELDNHAEFVGGIEYTVYGLADSDADLGIIAEYLYDEREKAATQPFQNDLLLGFRLAMNDEPSTEALLGVLSDLDGGGRLVSLEASRRLGSDFRLAAEAVLWRDTATDALLDGYRGEDYLQIELGYFF